jgi:hypothetical protein
MDKNTRLHGAGFLAICAIVLHPLYILVNTPPVHEGTVTEMLLALVVVLTGLFGFAMVVVGPALFRPYAWPPEESR